MHADPKPSEPRPAPAGRFEYRVFAPALTALARRLAGAASRCDPEPERNDLYLLAPEARYSVKLEVGGIDCKRRLEVRRGCQRWRPAGHRDFPLPAHWVGGPLTRWLGAPALPDGPIADADALLAALRTRAPRVHVWSVRKRRVRFPLGNAGAEHTRVRLRAEAGSHPRWVETAAVEGDDAREVEAWAARLGLRGRPNLSYPDYLRRCRRPREGEGEMGVEIERKFLVEGDAWRDAVTESKRLVQGYLVAEPQRSVRVRHSDRDAWLTVKGETEGASRPEFEYEIPFDDAAALLRLCRGSAVEKTRHRVPYGGHGFDVDEFHGANAGLVLAEVELASPDEEIALPAWVGREVTDDERYANAALSQRPFTSWRR